MDTATGQQADATPEPAKGPAEPPFPGAVRYGYRSDTVKI